MTMSLPLPLRSVTAHLARGAAIVVIVFASVAAGIGWLYVLRHVAVLRVGPRFPDALPLQRLAGGAAQPLGRMVVAWLPAGVIAALGIGLVSGLHRVARSLTVFVLALAFVFVATLMSDSLTHNESIRSQIHNEPHRAAAWVAAGLMAVGALLTPVIGRGAGRQAP